MWVKELLLPLDSHSDHKESLARRMPKHFWLFGFEAFDRFSFPQICKAKMLCSAAS